MANKKATRQRQVVSWKLVVLGLGALFALAAAVGLFGYFRYLKYERVAALHLPSDTAFAARIDVEQIVLFEPVRKHLLPLLNELGRRDAAHAPRLQRLKEKTGVELGADLRELVLARGPFAQQWLLVIGGRFPKQGVADGLAAILSEEGHAIRRISPDRFELVPDVGIGQAADGSVIIAQGVARMQSALPSQPTYERLGLAPEGPGGFALLGRVLSPLSSLATVTAPGLSDLAAIDSMTGELRLGDKVSVETLIAINERADTAGLEARGQALIQALARMAPLFVPGADTSALERAEVSLAEPRVLRVTVDWEQEELDSAARALRGALQVGLRGR